MKLIERGIFLLLLLCVNLHYSQSYNIKSISGLNGLSQSTVSSITVDNIGNVWLGTHFGLNKYNGRTVEKYFWDKDDINSITDDYIFMVYTDMNDEIWVSTLYGLCKYDRNGNNFIRNPLGITSNFSVETIFEDRDELWFPRRDFTFFIRNKNTEEVRELAIQPTFEFPRSTINILKIVEFNTDHLLMLVEDYGLALMNKDTGLLKPFLSINSAQLTSLEFIDDHFYIGSYEDVYKVSRSGDIISAFSEINPSYQKQIFLNVKENSFKNNIWLATDFGGVFIIDKNFKILKQLEAGDGQDKVLPENSVNDIYFINDHSVVLGTVRCGSVLLYNSGISYYRYDKERNVGPSDKSILSIAEDRSNNLWIGTDGGGLNRIDRENNVFEHYSIPEVRIVTALIDFSDKELLVASYQNGLYFFDKKSKEFSYAGDQNLFKHVKKAGTHRLYQDSSDRLWISDGNISMVDFKNNIRLDFDEQNYRDTFQQLYPMFYSAHECSSGKIWFCTVGGLYSYSFETNRFEDKIVLNDHSNYFGEAVYDIVEDKKGNFIIGTNKALLYYDFDSEKLTEFLEGSMDMNKQFSSLYLDLNEKLWVGTSNGMMSISRNSDGPVINEFHDLESQGNVEYRQNVILRSSNSRLYMGSNNGISHFNPEQIESESNHSKVAVTSFKLIGNKRSRPIDTTIVVNLTNDHHVTLNYTPAMYKFQFNAFNIPFEEKTNYSYTLENYEDIWHTGNGNTATYTNLSAGDYIFKVRSTNKSGQWLAETTNIHLTVLPPWYETIWFITSIIVLFSLIVAYVWNQSLVRLKLRHQLQIEHSEQEQLKETNRQKLTFFTNVSHEIKTPLTLIYSPLRYLLNKNASDEEIRDSLPSLYRNTKRMVGLIDQLLEFRKTEMTSLNLRIETIDCVELCKSIINNFDYFSKVENIQIEFICEFEELVVQVDSDKFSKVLFNLISNALKFSNTGDTVSIYLNADQEMFDLKVVDKGIGISNDEIKHIFNRYYQVENGVKGTGIGLALTKNLVELHSGSIRVESTVGLGSSFHIRMPLKQKNVEIIEPELKQKGISKEISTKRINIQSVNFNTKKEFKILIIDDEWEMRQYLKQQLAPSYIVETAKNGKEGFSKAVKGGADLIISDVMMPEMNGFELCENIKNDIRICHIPVVLLTAKNMHEDQIKGLKSGADIYISKPFDLDVLELQLQSLLKNRKIIKDRFEKNVHLHMDEVVHTNLDKEFLSKALNIVENNIGNHNFRVENFVNEMGMSRTLVYNKISAIAGKPVKDFILTVRIQKAAQLIATTNKPISDIAYACGFSDPSYFSTVFKRYYSESPISYRNKASDHCIKTIAD